MTVRRLTGEDWELFRDIRLRALADSPTAFGSTMERERAFTEADWRMRCRGPAFVAQEGAAPVALGATFVDAEGHLHVVAMWTEPGARGRGHATDILHALLDDAKAAGRVVELQVNLANAGAIAVYERFGFVRTGRTDPLRPGSAETAVTMRLR